MRIPQLDRRVLYLLLALVIAIPLLVSVPLPPPKITPPTKSFYDTLESVSEDPNTKDKLVIISCNFGAGTLAENLSQLKATLNHVTSKRMKFAIFAFNDPQGRDLGGSTAQQIADKAGYKYGEDWVNWGYRPPQGIQSLMKAMVNDLHGALGTDVKGTKLSTIPIMAKYKKADDVGLIIEFAASDTLKYWIQFFQRAGSTPIATLFCPTSVMANEAYPMLETGQLQGMLVGLKGASEYETVMHRPGFATQASASLSYSHLLIILLIIIGNIGMIQDRKRQQGASK